MFTILIVDDEKLERNGIKFLLKKEEEEFCVLEAGNGKDALEYWPPILWIFSFQM